MNVKCKKRHANTVGKYLYVYDGDSGVNGLVISCLLAEAEAGQCNQFNQNFDALTIVCAAVWERMIFHVPLCVFLIKMRATEKNYFGRLLAIMLITMVCCLGLYWLPDELFGILIKRVDMLSDLRPEDEVLLSDSTDVVLSGALPIDSLSLSDTVMIRDFNSHQITQRNVAYQALASSMPEDTTGTRIEDYSAGHTGLYQFFTSLNRLRSLNRPVRIAFLGDSFIEGDIIVADFRAKMQEYFGGRGVGFVPVASKVEQFRPTVHQRSKGWLTRSILSDRKYKYVLPGLLFDADSEAGIASISFKTVDAYPRLEAVSSLKFIYSRNTQSEIRWICNQSKDTIVDILPATDSIVQYEVEGRFTDGQLRFHKARGLRALGIALEDNTGVVVDNFSLRGNSGMTLSELDESSCIAFRNVRPYDLIVLQYGLNVVTEKTKDYSWYRKRMVDAIRHVQRCFPEADVLLLSVSDRSHYRDGAYRTMPSIRALQRAQREAAAEAGVPFWSVFSAMGGEGSIVRYVERRWASKDYTHLSFRGGRELASSLFDALILEKELYDEMDKKTY